MRAGQGTVQLLGGTGLRSIPSGFVPTIAPRGGLSAAHKPPLQQGYPLSPAIAGFVGIPLDARKQRLFAGQFIKVRHHTPYHSLRIPLRSLRYRGLTPLQTLFLDDYPTSDPVPRVLPVLSVALERFLVFPGVPGCVLPLLPLVPVRTREGTRPTTLQTLFLDEYPTRGAFIGAKPPLQQGYPLSPAIAGFVGIPLDARKQRLSAGQFIGCGTTPPTTPYGYPCVRSDTEG